jgi:GDP-L-fucose synthase
MDEFARMRRREHSNLGAGHFKRDSRLSTFWKDKRVLVTGGAGFVGTHVVEKLQQADCSDVFVARSRDYDLTKEEQCVRLLLDAQPDIVFHLAGLAGGIAANKARPAEFFYQNLTMGTFMLHHSWRLGVRKFVAAGSGHYPAHAPIPFREENLWEGLPQAETAPYSLAKRLLHTQSAAYYQQHGFVSVVCLLGNVYGPHQSFDPKASPVVPALIRRFVDATEGGDGTVTVWGSRRTTRDFIYAADVARGLLLAAEHYDRAELVNISTGVETSIRELTRYLADLTGFRGGVRWDASQPDSATRHCMDPSKAQRELGFLAQTGLREGLKHTVDWFRANRLALR